MKGKLKNIIVLILLVIFPISAVGMNISVHKCKLKGTIYFSLFGTINNNNEFICGCKAKVINPAAKKEAPSCCNKSNIEVESGECNENINTDNTGIQLLNSSCCSDSVLSYSIQNDFISNNKSDILTNLTYVLNILITNKRFNSNRTSFYLDKDLDYPLQELICHTISFIHFSSQTTTNSDEPPIHKC